MASGGQAIPMTRRFLTVLSILLTLLAGPLVPAARAGEKELKKQKLERLKQEMEEQKQKLKSAGKKERSVLSQLGKLDRDIQAGSAELADQQRKLREAEAALAEIERKNMVTVQELDRLKAAYAARLRALYKMSRQGGYAPALLAAESFPAAYKRVRSLGVIAARDHRLIEEYRRNLAQLSQREQETRERRAETIRRTAEVGTKRASLEVRRRQKAELLASVKQEKGTYEATLKDLEESSAHLWAMIRLAEPEKKAAPAKAPARERLPWPVNGQVLSSYGAQRHPQFGTMVFRRGIDISARTGDEVRSVDKGTVAWADWYKGYGKLVIIDHGAGLYSLYGHLSLIDVGKGDRVGRSQVIGRAGDTESLKGPRLYFEVRRNGEAEDPLLWLAPKQSAQR